MGDLTDRMNDKMDHDLDHYTGPGDKPMTDYETLKAYGFGPALAAQIVLDVKRGDHHAKAALAAARNFST